MQRFLEILSGIPNLVVMILMLVVFKPGIFSIVAAMAITNWIPMARIVRAQTMKLKDQEFVLAATTLGESRMKIAMKHILPNISSVIIVQMMFSIPSAIFFEAFLSFIGLGLKAAFSIARDVTERRVQDLFILALPNVGAGGYVVGHYDRIQLTC